MQKELESTLPFSRNSEVELLAPGIPLRRSLACANQSVVDHNVRLDLFHIHGFKQTEGQLPVSPVTNGEHGGSKTFDAVRQAIGRHGMEQAQSSWPLRLLPTCGKGAGDAVVGYQPLGPLGPLGYRSPRQQVPRPTPLLGHAADVDASAS